MDYLAGIFVPTGNRRLNELVGFLMSSPRSSSPRAGIVFSARPWNSASVLTGIACARNWIGVVGAFHCRHLLQFFGLGAFCLIIFPSISECVGSAH